jgi:hypothetical protein
MCNRNPIVVLNGEVTVWFVFQRVSSIHWARIAKQRFVSSARGFGDLKTKKNSFVSLSLLWRFYLGAFSFFEFLLSDEFSCFSLIFFLDSTGSFTLFT